MFGAHNFGRMGAATQILDAIAALFASGQPGAWFDPSDLTTLFQDAAGTTPVTALGQPVGLMRDKSGRGNHVSQATAAARPTYQQNAGGKYYLAFDGVDDSLSSSTGGGGTTGFFYCAALKPVVVPAAQVEIWSDQLGAAGYIPVSNSGTLRLYAANGSFPFVDAVGTLVAATAAIVTTWDDGATINAQLTDGTVGSAARAAVAAGGPGFTLFKKNDGAGNLFNCEFYGGIYAKDSGLTANQRASSKAWVRGKVGI